MTKRSVDNPSSLGWEDNGGGFWSWAGGEAIGEAPQDGAQYARQDADWSEVVIPDGDSSTVLNGPWAYSDTAATVGAFTTRNAAWFTATTLSMHKSDSTGYEHTFDLITEGDLIVVQAPAGGAEYTVISKTLTGDVCEFVVDVVSAFGTFPSAGDSAQFTFVPQIPVSEPYDDTEVKEDIAANTEAISGKADPITVGGVPADPSEGDQWLNTDDGYLYVYYGNGGSPTWMAVGGTE